MPELDWDKTINEILSGTMACQACNALGDGMVVGYNRSGDAAEFAERCRECVDKSDCDAGELVVGCEGCAPRERGNGEPGAFRGGRGAGQAGGTPV